jgi:O-antigen/teichoic acid export membrane protein
VFKEPNLVPLLRIAGLIIPFWTLVSVTAAAIRGFKGMHYDAIANKIFQPLIRFVLIAALALTIGLTPINAVVCFGLSIVTAAVMLFVWLNRLFSITPSIKKARIDSKEILGFALPVFASDLIKKIGPNLKLFLIGALSATVNVGIFGAIIEISIIGTWFYTALATASAPIIAELHDQQLKNQLKIFYQTTSRWVFTISLPVFLIILMFPEPILSVFGDQFITGVAALRIMAFSGLMSVGIGITYTLITMTGNAVLKLVNSIVMYATMLGLDFLLIPKYGVLGAAIASLAAVIVFSLFCVAEVFIIFRSLPFNLSFLKPIAGGLVAISVAFGIDFLLTEKAVWLRIVLSVTSLIGVYIAIIAFLGLSKEDRSILNHIFKRFIFILKKH